MAKAKSTRRGRPRVGGGIAVVHLGNLRLRRDVDEDLIRFFESLPRRRRHAGLKAALRGGMRTVATQDLSDDEELEAAAADFLK